VIRVAATLVAVGALLGAGAARSQSTVSTAAAANRVAFADARGENPGAIDVSRVVVSSTSSGDLTFRVEIPTNPTFAEGMRVRIWIDSDANPKTGRDGFEYFLLADDDVAAAYGCANPPTCDVFHQVPANSFRFSYRDGATFVVNRRSLGNTKRFRFFTAAYEGIVQQPGKYDLSNARYDFAPRAGTWWTFDSRALVVRAFTATPATPASGRPFALRLSTVRTDTGAALTSGVVSCSLRIGGQRLTPRSTVFVKRRAVCAYDVPAGASGARYRAKITVRAGANAVSRSLAGRVG
jgi:hypothetical protein